MELLCCIGTEKQKQTTYPIGIHVCHVTHHSVDGHVQDPPGPHDVEEAVDVLEDGHHHLILVLGGGPAGGATASLNPAASRPQ